MSKNQKAFTLLGRYGDSIIALPAFRHIADSDGVKPLVITSSKFAGIYDGVGYVETAVIPDDTGENYKLAAQYALENKLNPRVLRFWMDPRKEVPETPMNPLDSSVSFRGKTYHVNFTKWKSYQHAIFDRTGVPLDLMNRLPLVFDSRNRSREKRLVAETLRANKKDLPVLLYAMQGHTSSLAARPEVEQEIFKWKEKYFLVDLSKIVAEKPYDLLGLFDAAKLLVTIDTMHLHLAAASPVRFIAYLHDANGDWGMSAPSKNCMTSIRYRKARALLGKLNNFISSNYNT
jgi:hypothetical protein